MSAGFAVYVGVLCGLAAQPAGGQAVPPFAAVEKAVWRYFEDQTDFQAGDLIVREDVAPLLDKLRRQWLPAPEAKKILESVPAKDDFIAAQFSTPAGRKFMRRIAAYPNAFDRVDRLSRLPRGRQTVEALIRGPDGYKMIEYMTTARGGRELGRQLSNAPAGKRFNQPTGRIYTVAMLLDRLQESHAALLKATAESRDRN